MRPFPYSFIQPQRVITDGLILYLDVSNTASYPGTGTTWTDISYNNNNGTLVNGVTYNSDNGGSLDFDGSDDYVSLTNTTLVNASQPFTVYLWMRHNPRTSGQLFHRMLTLKSSEAQPLGIAYINGTASRYSGLYLTAASGWVRGSNGYFPTANVWGMLTVTYNGAGSTTGSNFKMYWNGVDIGFTADPLASTVSITNASFIGTRRTTADDQIYRGRMSILAVYNTLHGINEIQQNFNATRVRFGI
jgi:hypothetical protein